MASYKVAYGKRKNITSAINGGVIPPGCIILTEDSNEIFFYDLTRQLKTYESKTKFSSRAEAEIWVRKYDCSGNIISIHEDGKCNAYVVNYDGQIERISSAGGGDTPGETTVVVQADFLIEDPKDPSYIKNKPTSYPISFIEGLEEALLTKVRITNKAIPGSLIIADSTGNIEGSNVTIQELMSTLSKKVEITDTIVEGALMVSDGKGGLRHEQTTTQEIFSTLSRKVEVSGSVSPGSLMVATEEGNLQCCGVKYSDIVLKGDIVTGSITSSVSLKEDGVYVISIPEDVLTYPNIHVYHNGMLLLENVHYTVGGKFITLIGHSTYAGDLFAFVGYGSTGSFTDVGSDHTHANKFVLDTITQEMVDRWNSGIPSSGESFVSKEELFGNDGLILPELLPQISAQENKIEEIAIGDTVLPIANKIVTIPIGGENTLGVVKSSTDMNKVRIEEDGTMSVTGVDATKLLIPEGEELILVAGDSK